MTGKSSKYRMPMMDIMMGTSLISDETMANEKKQKVAQVGLMGNGALEHVFHGLGRFCEYFHILRSN